MIELAPGTTISGTEWTLLEHIVGDAWGQLWRARHPSLGNAFAVLYTTPEGEALYNEALPALRRWQEVARSGLVPQLLQIHGIIDSSAIPCVLVEDPGGRLLRQLVTTTPPDVRTAVTIMAGVAKGILGVKMHDIGFAGLTPDSIVEAPGNAAAPWRLLPVYPGVRNAVVHVWGGRYAPPEHAGAKVLGDLHADIYGLSWILAELVAGNAALGRDPRQIAVALPYRRLRTILSNGFQPLGGAYADPKLTAVALDRWIRKESEEDMQEYVATQKATRRSAGGNFFSEHRRLFLQGGCLAGVLLAIGLLVWLVPKMFTAPTTSRDPFGMTTLFLKAIVDRDAAAAKKYTRGSAALAVDAWLADIKRMEDAHLCSRFASAAPRIQGGDQAKNVKIDLYGENRDNFMKAEMTIKPDNTGEWYVETLFFEPVRTDDEE